MTLAVALITGLIQGFLHCSAMCGPFVLAFGLTPRGADRQRWRSAFQLHLLHNAGRIATFVLLGAVFGWVGSFVNAALRLTGVQAAVGVVGGVLMILWAIDQARTGRAGGVVERWSLLGAPPVRNAFRRLVGRRDPAAAFLSGGLLGFHPCGLIFAMLLAAAATGSAASGALTLLLFGLGTAPALLSVAALGTFFSGALSRRHLYNYISAAVVLAGGLLFALRGLAVNGLVPHVSPWLF